MEAERETTREEDAQPQTGAAFYAFCEALLMLEWPGRRVAVTPAPFVETIQEACDALGIRLDGRDVLDVSVGPLGDADPSFVCFRVVVREHVINRDWPAVASCVLEKARHDFARWPKTN